MPFKNKSISTRLLPAFSVLILSATAVHSTCIPSGTQADIQAALNSPAKTAELCQAATFTIASPIIITANGSRIYTKGLPNSDSQKAFLAVTGNFDAPAIQSYTASGVEIRNIFVWGVRLSAPGYICHQALLAVQGNNSLVDRVTFLETKGLSALDASTNPSCSGLQVTNNRFLSNGYHTQASTFCLDGGQMKPNGPWANAIDYRCSNGYVAFNEIRDATDGAISFYGGTNTVIEYNSIINEYRSAYSDIIAASLYAGDFTGYIVRNNSVSTTNNQHVHVALAIGTHLWCNDPEHNGDCSQGHGVSFLNNYGTGIWGWGINVDGHYNATVLGNNLNMTPWTPINCQQTPFNNYYTVNLQHSTGVFQAGYVNRQTHWPCLIGTPNN